MRFAALRTALLAAPHGLCLSPRPHDQHNELNEPDAELIGPPFRPAGALHAATEGGMWMKKTDTRAFVPPLPFARPTASRTQAFRATALREVRRRPPTVVRPGMFVPHFS